MNKCVLLAVLLYVAACSGIAVPPEKKDYVGRWVGGGVTLVITADGGVGYEKIGAGGNTEINAPIKAFEGNNFVVGAFGFTTTFEVQKPPYRDGDSWKMMVDGVDLTRVP